MQRIDLQQESLIDFEEFCFKIIPNISDPLFHYRVAISAASEQVHSSINKLHGALSQVPILSFILVWARKMEENKTLGRRYLQLMHELISIQLFPVIQKNQPILLENYVSMGHDIILNHIRSHSSWFLQKREDVVAVYINFTQWCSDFSVNYVHTAVDHDREIASKRRLSYEKYIELLSVLPHRERIITQLFYLGGARSLEDILALKIANVNHTEGHIQFEQGGSIRYPQHILEDIKTYLKGREKGFMFSNMQSTDRINHTIPYRALKKAAQKIGLPSSFSYKDLVKEV